jgi:hypothetical protein
MVGHLGLLVAKGCRSIPGYEAMITTMRCSNRIAKSQGSLSMVLSIPRRRGYGEKKRTTSRFLQRPPANDEWTVGMENYFWVAIGGALGTMGRYWCSDFIARLVGETFPWGTLAVS